MIRKLHRWISTGTMLFIAYVVLTGTTVAINELINSASFGTGGGEIAAAETIAGPQGSLPPQAQVEQMVGLALESARRAEPTAPLTKVMVALRMRGGRPEARVIFGSGVTAVAVTVDANTGQVLRRGDDGAHFNTLLQQIHSGALYGKAGQVAVVLTGFSLITLSVTGALMYLDLFGRRRRLGKSDLFWR